MKNVVRFLLLAAFFAAGGILGRAMFTTHDGTTIVYSVILMVSLLVYDGYNSYQAYKKEDKS